MSKGEVFLKLQNVSKTFPGVKALDKMQIEVKAAEIHALVGENGAGKSTLMKVLSGTYQPDEGAEIYVEGQKLDITNPLVSLRAGIAVIYQDFSIFPNLSVAENISISQEIEKNTRKLNWHKMKETAAKALKRLDVDMDLDIPVGKLSVAKQQLVAIARALVYDAKLLIMDEPTSALSKEEVEHLFKIMRNLQKEGLAIIFISHKLDELFEIAERFTIMRDGKYMGTFDKSEIDSEKLISLMVGRKIFFKQYERSKAGDVLLEVRHLSKRGNYKDVSFSLKKGEILGFTGLVGAGRTEMMQALFGLQQPDEGEILIDGKKVTIPTTESAVRQGISFVPENRLTEGVINRQSIAKNITVTVLNKLVNGAGILQTKKEKEVYTTWIKKLNIKPGIPEMEVQKLSGGNMQRVVIAKWLASDPKILIIDEPTNGIDVGAKDEIHKLLKQLASTGIGIIMISSELPEILAISDRIMVVRRGRIAAELENEGVTQEQIMSKAV